MQPRPLTAVLAVLFAALTVAAYGSGTGPGTTANSGTDESKETVTTEQLPPITVTERVPAPPQQAQIPGAGECQPLQAIPGPAYGQCMAARAQELQGQAQQR